MTDQLDLFDWIDDIHIAPDDTALETARQLERPKTHERREAKRRFVNGLKKQALTDLIPELPEPGTDLYILGNGSGAEVRHGINPAAFDFGTFIPYLAEILGTGCNAYISSWTMNRGHSLSIIELLDNGNIGRLTVFTDPYFQRREPSVANTLISGIQRHPGRARYLAFKNHVKVIAMSDAGNTRFCTITGSANLSAQPRCEQYVLTTAPDVYHFFKTEFFESMEG